MNRTKIEWADYTWNPVTGCLNGCPYCYARKIAARFPKAFPLGFKPMIHIDRLGEPLKLKKPARIFTVSMGDLFGDWVPPGWQHKVFEIVDRCPRHTFIFLTKNKPGMIKALREWYRGRLPANVWAGVTLTGQEEPGAVNPSWHLTGGKVFVSYEPVLGPPDLEAIARVDWLIIGAQTNPRLPTGDLFLQSEWTAQAIAAARDAEIPIFLKDSLRWHEEIREFPGGI